MQKIVFVCLGNICRSPTAEAVVATKARARAQAILVDSAGTGDWHVGEPPYGPMQAAAARRGYDLSTLRARQVCAGDFEAFDVIVVMDEANQRDVEALRPKGNTTPVRLMMSYAPDIGVTAVPDPYYTRNFDEALDLIEAAAEGLLAVLDP
ncbi:low molecular weight protein-tyrosine-phosphatase [Celeribacter baekdonensis]|uniref:low molecular weight protein-tyrosine-phosphatase n=1 Tax=Celeribacter baekdonensis TaxID=875171 RepID=UPI0030D757A8|tara:strand:- start:18102 stop:18554 length:453 start_codon:yes stop_codon:yes gene_type:complete